MRVTVSVFAARPGGQLESPCPPGFSTPSGAELRGLVDSGRRRRHPRKPSVLGQWLCLSESLVLSLAKWDGDMGFVRLRVKLQAWGSARVTEFQGTKELLAEALPDYSSGLSYSASCPLGAPMGG